MFVFSRAHLRDSSIARHCHKALSFCESHLSLLPGLCSRSKDMATTLSKFSPSNLPLFSDLPLHPSHPPHSCWGLWGEDDELGCLNLLDAECVKAAAREIKSGVSVGLSWELHQMHIGFPFRITLKHRVFPLSPYINVSFRVSLPENDPL